MDMYDTQKKSPCTNLMQFMKGKVAIKAYFKVIYLKFDYKYVSNALKDIKVQKKTPNFDHISST